MHDGHRHAPIQHFGKNLLAWGIPLIPHKLVLIIIFSVAVIVIASIFPLYVPRCRFILVHVYDDGLQPVRILLFGEGCLGQNILPPICKIILVHLFPVSCITLFVSIVITFLVSITRGVVSVVTTLSPPR